MTWRRSTRSSTIGNGRTTSTGWPREHGTGSSRSRLVVILRVLLIGESAQRLADKVRLSGIEDFRLDGTLVLPAKGDRVTRQRIESVEFAWLGVPAAGLTSLRKVRQLCTSFFGEAMRVVAGPTA